MKEAKPKKRRATLRPPVWDRAVAAFVAEQAWVLLVGPHDDADRAADVYAQLYDILDPPHPDGERNKSGTTKVFHTQRRHCVLR